MILNFFIVPHTHWDREWYLPFEHFRIILARTIDDVLDTLEENPEMKFTLDGQAVILEDYLAIRPKQRDRLKNLVGLKKLAIGPLYVLPDEYLSGQESLIRNFLIGKIVCQDLGEPMNIGYMPDPFGHIAQMPQILRGFGIDNFIFWRGLGNDGKDLGAVFNWVGLDGSKVLAVRYFDGYGSGRNLGHWINSGDIDIKNPEDWPKQAVKTISQFMEKFGDQFKIAHVSDILLGNGSDHLPIQKDLPQILQNVKKMCSSSRIKPGWQTNISTYEDYLDILQPKIHGIKSYKGEMCSGREAPVLRGINSTRIYLKIINEQTERALLSAEVLASLAKLFSIKNNLKYEYPLFELRQAWKNLLQNLPHDSISGCSVDEVYQDVETRFQNAWQIAQTVAQDATMSLGGFDLEDGTFCRGKILEKNELFDISFINTLPWRRKRLVEINLDNRKHFFILNIDGFSSATLEASGADLQKSAAFATGNRVENEFYKVTVEENGSIQVFDKKTKENFKNLHVIEDQADCGDEYNFCPLKNDTSLTNEDLRSKVTVLEKGPLFAELLVELPLKLPQQLNKGRTSRSKLKVLSPVKTHIRLVSGIDRIEFSTKVVNKASDHRLRLIFEGAEPQETVKTVGHFAVLERPVNSNIDTTDWVEQEIKTHHNSGAIKAGSLIFLNKGLPEYEVIPKKGGLALAVTLIRSVGWLSRGDLSIRPGHAGPELETPGAQCLGSYHFEYALSFQKDLSDIELARQYQDFRFNFIQSLYPKIFKSPISLEGDFAFSSLKGSEDSSGLILRIYNPGDKPSEVSIKSSDKFRKCRLDETHIEPGGIDSLQLKPYQISTLFLKTQ